MKLPFTSSSIEISAFDPMLRDPRSEAIPSIWAGFEVVISIACSNVIPSVITFPMHSVSEKTGPANLLAAVISELIVSGIKPASIILRALSNAKLPPPIPMSK